MDSKNLVRIDLGCGTSKEEGCIGVDYDSECKPDVLHDLNRGPYPFADESADEIISNHCIEHLDDPQLLIREASRILKKGCKVIISLPHPSDVEAMWGTIDHKRPLPFNWIQVVGHKNGLKVAGIRLSYFNHRDRDVSGWKRMLGSCVNAVANIKPNWFERVAIYWVGGMSEMTVELIKGGD